MPPFDWKAFGEEVAKHVRSYVDGALGPILDRLKTVEDRAPEKGDPGAPGKDGEPGKEGKPGSAGASVTVEDVAPLIASEVAKAVSALPPAKDGKDGEPGMPGKDVDMESIVALVREAVGGIPVPKDGKDGESGRDGRDASDLTVIRQFVADEVAAQAGNLFKGIVASSDDQGRTIVLSLDAVGLRCEIKTAVVLDRGVWKSGKYAQGDGVTFGGSFWIAQKDTETKPDTEDSDWRLSVKRGRDGRDATAKEPAAPKMVALK